jgi:hypothetical protein
MEILISIFQSQLFGFYLFSQGPHLLASIGPPTGSVYLELIFGCIFAIYMVVRAMTLRSDAAYVRDRRSRHSRLK